MKMMISNEDAKKVADYWSENGFSSKLIFSSYNYLSSVYNLKREEISKEYELVEIAFSDNYPIECLLCLKDPRENQTYIYKISVFEEYGPTAKMQKVDIREYLHETQVRRKYTVIHPVYFMTVSIGYHLDMFSGKEYYFIFSRKENGITERGEFSIDTKGYYQKSVWKFQDHRFAIGAIEYAILPWSINDFMDFHNLGKITNSDLPNYEREFCEIDDNDVIHYGIRPSSKVTNLPEHESFIFELIRKNPNLGNNTLATVMHDYTKTSEDDKFNVIYVFTYKV